MGLLAGRVCISGQREETYLCSDIIVSVPYIRNSSYLRTILTKFVGSKLMDCDFDDDDRRRSCWCRLQKSQTGKRLLGGLGIVDIDASNPKDELSGINSCMYFLARIKFRIRIVTLLIRLTKTIEKWRDRPRRNTSSEIK